MNTSMVYHLIQESFSLFEWKVFEPVRYAVNRYYSMIFGSHVKDPYISNFRSIVLHITSNRIIHEVTKISSVVTFQTIHFRTETVSLSQNSCNHIYFIIGVVATNTYPVSSSVRPGRYTYILRVHTLLIVCGHKGSSTSFMRVFSTDKRSVDEVTGGTC